MGGAPADPRSQEELASKGMPRRTGVPGRADLRGMVISAPKIEDSGVGPIAL